MFENQLNKIRFSILESCYKIKEGHIGSAFSVLEIVFVIFKRYFINYSKIVPEPISSSL